MSQRGETMSTIQFKEANCKNCHKCIRSCPVKAIAFNNQQASIIEKDCILCGNCLKACPQNAKSVRSDVSKVKSFIEKNEKVYVSLAPSYMAAFEASSPNKIFGVLKRLGFTHIEETAVGAIQVSKEYDRLAREKKMTNIITTACPTLIFLIEKYYPQLIDQMAPVVSPMIAHAKMMRAMYGPRIKIVFIGPCLAKKEECNDFQNEGIVDAVITFEELQNWIDTEGINFEDEEEEQKGISNPIARFYPAPGGIIKTLSSDVKKNYKCIGIDGIDRCTEVLESINTGKLSGYILEMNTCAGGCIGGPCSKTLEGGFLEARERLSNYIKRCSKEIRPGIIEDAKVDLKKKFFDRSKKPNIPDEKTIREILSKIGKFDKEKELNCGACGYSSCREKAIAVYNQKAELYMCLPYMKERAESISNLVMQSTPNAIFALDRELRIQECNHSAERIFGINKDTIHGKYIYELLDCPDFEAVRETRQSIVNKKFSYDEYKVIVEQSTMYIEEHQVLLVVMKDITAEEKQKQHMYEIRSDAADIAQKVIEKQMRVVQEIASILGETTAETKIALTKLKKSMLQETGDEK